MIYNNGNTGFIFRYIGVHQTPIPKIPILLKKYLDSFIITVLANDIFYALITKMVLMARPKSESIYLMKFMKFCTHILDT